MNCPMSAPVSACTNKMRNTNNPTAPVNSTNRQRVRRISRSARNISNEHDLGLPTRWHRCPIVRHDSSYGDTP